MVPVDLLANAIAAGIMLGGFYAAAAIGLAIVFGHLDIVNIAHPAFIVVGSYVAWMANSTFGLDPIVAGIVAAPVFFALGAAFYRVYHAVFERSREDSLSGLAFFFGVMFIVEVALALIYGADYRLVQTDYAGRTLRLGFVDFPLRMLVPFAVAAAMSACVHLYLSRTFTGRAIQAVAQDQLALRLTGADPVRVKQWAFGLAMATAVIAGGLLIVIGPVEPATHRQYIGRVFAIVVLGGIGSIQGMFIAALMLGIVESLIATFAGPSWSPAVAFGLLAFTLALRGAGLSARP